MVNVIGINGGKLNPCTEAKARHLLNDKKAEIVERVPFTIRLNFAVTNSIGTPDPELTTLETEETAEETEKTVEVDGKIIKLPRFYVKSGGPAQFARDLERVRKEYSTSRFSFKPAYDPKDWKDEKSTGRVIRGRKFKVGKLVKLGRIPEKLEPYPGRDYSHYPFKDGYAGKPVEWRVLDIDSRNNAVLLLSDKILFYDAVNDKAKRRLEDVEDPHFYRWTESDICMYLNTDFIREFSLDKLPFACISHKTEAGWFNKTEPTEYSAEKIFLLSREEVEKYLPKAEDRISEKVDESHKEALKNGYCYANYWLLRTPGNKYDTRTLSSTFVERGISGPTLVDSNGIVISSDALGLAGYGIRPAMWLRIV